MASVNAIVFLSVLLVLQSRASASGILSPYVDDVCKKVECGKGTCRSSHNSTFFFECVCDPGWKQALPYRDNDFKFLPCVIPNCSMNYSCTKATPKPAHDKAVRACHWTNCGGGKCNRLSPFTHSCLCREGYYNLLDVAAFPCFKKCALGLDCAILGVTVMNKSSSSTPSLADNSENQACSRSVVIINWSIVILTASWTMVFRR